MFIFGPRNLSYHHETPVANLCHLEQCPQIIPCLQMISAGPRCLAPQAGRRAPTVSEAQCFGDVERLSGAHCTEDRADISGDGGALGGAGVVLRDDGGLRPDEFAQEPVPFRPEASLDAASPEFLGKDHGEERAEDVARGQRRRWNGRSVGRGRWPWLSGTGFRP